MIQKKILQNLMQVRKNRNPLKSFWSNLLSNTILIFIKISWALKWLQTILNLISNKFLLIHSNPQIRSPTFQDDRDPDLNYFDKVNVSSKVKWYTNESDIKHFLYETQRIENISVLHINIRGLKTNFENFCNLLNNNSSSFSINCLMEIV